MATEVSDRPLLAEIEQLESAIDALPESPETERAHAAAKAVLRRLASVEGLVAELEELLEHEPALSAGDVAALARLHSRLGVWQQLEELASRVKDFTPGTHIVSRARLHNEGARFTQRVLSAEGLRRAMAARGWSLSDLACEAALTERTITRALDPTAALTVQTENRILAAIGRKPVDLDRAS